MLGGAELTRVRTAAMTTLAVSRGAAAFGKLALFGAGLQGRAHPEALLGALRLTDLTAIGSGQAAWRLTPEEIVVFKSVGVGLSDLAAAAAVWERLGG